MPNQCVHCSEIYADGAQEVLSGCSKCSSKFFFYLSQEKLNKLKESKEENVPELSKEEKIQIEKDVRDIAGIEEADAPVILDFESVKVIKPGKYILDLPKLLSGYKPLVYKLEDGKYVIDLSPELPKRD